MDAGWARKSVMRAGGGVRCWIAPEEAGFGGAASGGACAAARLINVAVNAKVRVNRMGAPTSTPDQYMSSFERPIPIRDLAHFAKADPAVHPVPHAGGEQHSVRSAALSREMES